MFLKIDNVGAERIYSGRLFQETGPATRNARKSIYRKLTHATAVFCLLCEVYSRKKSTHNMKEALNICLKSHKTLLHNFRYYPSG